MLKKLKFFVRRKKRRYQQLKPILYSVIVMGSITMFLLIRKIISNTAIVYSKSIQNLLNFNETSRVYNRKVPNVCKDNWKLDKIRKEMMFAWTKYRDICWGKGELLPLSKKCVTDVTGLTMVDSLSTLWIMGLHREFNYTRDYIRDHFKLEGEWSTFEIIIRFLGGYLSAYQLSNDSVFLDKAIELGNALFPLINLTDGNVLSTAKLQYEDGKLVAHGIDNEVSSLSERGSLQLEYLTLYYLTKDEKFFDAAFAFYRNVWKKSPDFALLSSPYPKNKKASMVIFAGGFDSYYEYIIKTYLLTGQKSKAILKRHMMMVDEIKKTCLYRSKRYNITCIGWRDLERVNPIVDHLATFVGGMIAVGSVKDNEKALDDLKLSAELVDGYYKAYDYFYSGIAPDSFHVSDDDDHFITMDSQYHLRPETVESIYMQWKLTGNPIYRRYAWEIFLSIKKYCKSLNGYVGIVNVNIPTEWQIDKQYSYFLSETLKYIYLTFESSYFLSHDDWVFNTEAHPLKIWDEEFANKTAEKIDKLFV